MVYINKTKNVDRYVANRIGATLLFMVALQFAVAILVYFIIALFLGFQPYLNGFSPASIWRFYYDFCVKAKSFALSYPIALFITAAFANGIPLLICCKKFKVNITSFFNQPKSSGSHMLLYGVTGLGASFLFSFLINLLSYALSLVHIKISTPSFKLPTDSFVGSLLMLAAVIFIGPLTEELVFRGILLRAFRRYGNWFAVIASSFFWAILHGNLIQAIPVFVMGIFFGIMAVKSGSVWPSLIVHTLNNALAIIENLIPKTETSTLALMGLFTLLLMFLAIILFCVFLKEFRLEKTPLRKSSTGVRTYLSSWTVVIFILIMLALITLSVRIV